MFHLLLFFCLETNEQFSNKIEKRELFKEVTIGKSDVKINEKRF